MAKKSRWFIPTNLDNLRMIIAQGLISSPDGFKKYYTDVMEYIPGYIPIFKNKIQQNILKDVISEVDGLVPCILEIEIGMIEGVVKVIENSSLVDIAIENVDSSSNEVFFIQAPLPLGIISKVIFRTNAEKNVFEKDASLYSNVPLSGITLHYTKTDQKVFETKADITDLSIASIKNIDVSMSFSIDYKKIYAFGGMLINLFYFSKNGQISNEVFMNAIDNNPRVEGDESIILKWFAMKTSENEVSINHLLYRGLVKAAVEADDFKEDIIAFLNSLEKAHSIAQKMIDFESASDKPVSEYFKEAKTRYGKALLMLFVREDSDSLIDYELDVFDEHDYLIFAMLFGIRDKFIKVPKFIREFDGLQNFVTVKMANYAHRSVNSSVSFKEPKIPMTIVNMLKSNRFKEYVAKELKMEHCFQTIIPSSDYTVVKGKPILPGIVIPKFEILEDAYFDFMSKYKLLDYNKFLKKYEKIK
jgi:hypothetical protein